jgi:hypothetical protein
MDSSKLNNRNLNLVEDSIALNLNAIFFDSNKVTACVSLPKFRTTLSEDKSNESDSIESNSSSLDDFINNETALLREIVKVKTKNIRKKPSSKLSRKKISEYKFIEDTHKRNIFNLKEFLV